ncbi:MULTISPECIES: thiamine-phosphate kinase [Pseudomonas]|uniref:thiamine-phosphate kinase n=1 Tax=Pseudomonas TaxID=286 RepID=UPI0018E8412C|nr:AIR synthase related protein [Pseudomonas carnis]MBJ2213335.1 hypothetical protein [Pseudomonas carnis]
MTTMSELGEKAFLRSLLPSLHVDKAFINGFGHDASIIDLGLEQFLAFKIDRAPFPVAIHRGIGDYRTWGRLAVVANVSDLLAVGAKPRALMLSVVVPGDFESENLREIIAGCEDACADHDIAFLGGDTKEGPASQVIGAALGTVEKDAAYGRGIANSGDYLFIAGRLGGFAAATALIEKKSFKSPPPEKWTHLLTHPTARILEGNYLRNSKKIAAACDLSDGLTEAIQIFCRNGTGISIDEATLPMHPFAVEASEKFDVPLWNFAFGVGDWAIACVVRETDIDNFRAGITDELELFEIGRFNSTGQMLVIDGKGLENPLPSLINEHFRKRAEDDGSYLNELLHKP